MAYEIYLLPLPRGADPEDEGEALLARLERFDEVRTDPALAPDLARIAEALRTIDADLRDPEPRDEATSPRPLPVLAMRGGGGIEVTVARGFVRVRVPFDHSGAAADAVFARVFRLLSAAHDRTGWVAYDPQDAGPVDLDDEGRAATLLIYLTAMDQIRPGAGPSESAPPFRR